MVSYHLRQSDETGDCRITDVPLQAIVGIGYCSRLHYCWEDAAANHSKWRSRVAEGAAGYEEDRLTRAENIF